MSYDVIASKEHDFNQTEFDLSKSVAETLMKHYPNHRWGVRVSQGVIYVKNLTLSGKFGFIVKLTDVYSASDLDKKLLLAGGEILERFRLSREAMGFDRIEDKAVVLPTDFAGNLVFDK